MLNFLKDSFVDIKAAERMPEEKLVGKFLMGEFKYDDTQEEYTERYAKLIERVKEAK
jgi:2-oxoglutarate ferredoxin oxidoreductase subunit beta